MSEVLAERLGRHLSLHVDHAIIILWVSAEVLGEASSSYMQ